MTKPLSLASYRAGIRLAAEERPVAVQHILALRKVDTSALTVQEKNRVIRGFTREFILSNRRIAILQGKGFQVQKGMGPQDSVRELTITDRKVAIQQKG